MKTQPNFRVYNPDRLLLMPPDPAKWLPEDHLVYFIREVIGRLDLCAFVEPVFGQIKPVRGFRQFLMRGLEKVSAEWDLICLTHNLLKLFRCSWASAMA